MKLRAADAHLHDMVALDFIGRYPDGVFARDLFENGPIATEAEARAIVRRLARAGWIQTAQTAKGGRTGRWWLTDAGRSRSCPLP